MGHRSWIRYGWLWYYSSILLDQILSMRVYICKSMDKITCPVFYYFLNCIMNRIQSIIILRDILYICIVIIVCNRYTNRVCFDQRITQIILAHYVRIISINFSRKWSTRWCCQGSGLRFHPKSRIPERTFTVNSFKPSNIDYDDDDITYISGDAPLSPLLSSSSSW